MSHIIHFRTHKKYYTTGEASSKKIQTRGVEYDGIRLANTYDDARDIAWKQSLKNNDTIYVKSREDTSNVSIILTGTYDISWDFRTGEKDTKHEYHKNLARICDMSTKQLHLNYIHIDPSFSIENNLGFLLKNHIKNKVIIYTISSLNVLDYEDFKYLARHNDIIIVHILHPFEIDPELYDYRIIEGHYVDMKQYKKIFSKALDDIEETLGKNNIGYVRTDISEDPALCLNQYFKYHYAQ